MVRIFKTEEGVVRQIEEIEMLDGPDRSDCYRNS